LITLFAGPRAYIPRSRICRRGRHAGCCGWPFRNPSHTFAAEVRAAQDGDRELWLLQTSRPGVFAAGDVRSGSIKRVASAVGEGAVAVRFLHEYLAGASARAREPVVEVP